MAAGAAISGYRLTPYCGQPPSPASLISRWNLDPVLLAFLAICFIAYLVLPIGASANAKWRRGCFYGGWALAVLTLASPLCPLSVSLFSARVTQHMLLATVVAPLIALGAPAKRIGGGNGWAAAIAFGAILWFWHAPGPYTATFESTLAYWAMDISIVASAYWLWAELSAPKAPLMDILAAIAVTSLQMGVLGAIITFAPRSIYAVHALTTAAWGLSPLDDQQLGGVIMWVPAGVIFVGALVGSVAWGMRRAELRSPVGVSSKTS